MSGFGSQFLYTSKPQAEVIDKCARWTSLASPELVKTKKQAKEYQPNLKVQSESKVFRLETMSALLSLKGSIKEPI